MRAAALVLMLWSVRLNLSCIKEESTLICFDFPAYFDSGFSSLLFTKKLGEINSTMFSSENLTSVTRFRLEFGDIAVIADGAFSSMLNLGALSLDGNFLKEVSPNWLGAPGLLTELNFTGNHMETVTELMLDKLVNLSKLRLNRNNIRSIDPNSFQSQIQLAELDLSENMLTRLSPQVLGSLTSTRIRLDGNPWDCSCGAEQFVSFLKDLQSRELLQRQTDVKCGSPLSLSGQPVLSVSVCGSSPSSPSGTHPPPTKSTSTPTSTSIVSTRWRNSSAGNSMPMIEPSTSTSSGPTPPETVSCPLQPSTKTLRTLAAVIGILLLLLFILAVMHKKKCSIKSVTPSNPREEEKKLEQDATSTASPAGSEDGVPDEANDAKMRPFSLAGVKSAHAIILTSPFCQKQMNQITFQMETELNEGLNVENPLSGKPAVENLINVADVKPQCEKQEDEELHPQCVCPNSDTLPYFSIDIEQINKQPSEGSAGAQARRVIGRVSTWPPTVVQWQARCKMKEQEDATFWTTHRNEVFNGENPIVKHLSPPDQSKIPSSTKTHLQLNLTPEEQEENQDMIQNMIHNQATLDPSVLDADTSRLEQEKNQDQETKAPEPNRTSGPNLADPSPTIDTVQHGKGIDSKTDPSGKPTAPGTTSQRQGKRAAGSKGASGGASPDDETLLSGNEYICMDLLHEVVQNNGRWTRERWKQVHANRQRR